LTFALFVAEARNPIVRWEYFVDEWDQIRAALVEHFELTVVSVAIGFVISAALAAVALRYRFMMGPIRGLAGVLYTIPSVALFGILVTYTGVTRTPAIIALVSYTLLILVTNIVAGFRAVPDSVRDAADGMGLSPTRRVLTVELPLAIPFIVTGLRIATVTTVGLVTVSAFVGLGGLGRLILDGLEITFWTKMTIGAGLSILMAIALDAMLFGIGRAITPWARRSRP
jgi:osmoprotectant transport system permease protein